MKKVIILAITLFVIGFAITPQVQAQGIDQATVNEIEQLTADFQAGRITAQEYQRRMLEIQSRVAAGNQGSIDLGNRLRPQAEQEAQQRVQQQQQERQQQQQADMYPGETRGWPTASIFSDCNLPNLRQPAGTTVSYTYVSSNRRLVLYMMNGSRNTIDELVNAVEAGGNVIRKDVFDSGNWVNLYLPKPNVPALRSSSGYVTKITTIEGGVSLSAENTD